MNAIQWRGYMDKERDGSVKKSLRTGWIYVKMKVTQIRLIHQDMIQTVTMI